MMRFRGVTRGWRHVSALGAPRPWTLDRFLTDAKPTFPEPIAHSRLRNGGTTRTARRTYSLSVRRQAE